MRTLTALWERAFLVERPSVSLALFRWFVALTVGCHMIPSLLPLADNYLSTAFKTQNPSFFPPPLLAWVAHSPDALVYVMVGCFLLTWLSFTVGCYAQMSCILMTLACYYFYALNDLHIGTLSFDILLVTLVLMCLTPYHGDAFSLDALRRDQRLLVIRPRPLFLQRLLQLQMASTYFFTGLNKIIGGGNWLTDNPIYYLVHSPEGSVVKEFWGREWLATQPQLCYVIGLTVIISELALPVLWFIRRTRLAAILIGWCFHVLLLVTLHVPTIFFFLFPAQIALFWPPEQVVTWLTRRR